MDKRTGKPVYGYTQGTFDMFHIGHLNLLEQAKAHCDYLVVGVNTDRLVNEYKHKTPIIPDYNRARIVGAINCVNEVILTDTLDKTVVAKSVPFQVCFIGDDWKGNDRWAQTEEDLAGLGIDVIYLSHTDGISSTGLRKVYGNSVLDIN